jgi:hypothetical protein
MRLYVYPQTIHPKPGLVLPDSASGVCVQDPKRHTIAINALPEGDN